MADWPSVFQSVFGPLIGAAITLYATRSSDREKVSAAIIWMDYFDANHGLRQWPSLHVHNRGGQAIMIAAFETRIGLILRRRSMEHFPLDYDDPTDLAFPYRVEPGEARRFALDQLAFDRAASTAGRLAKMAGLARIAYIRVGLRTMSGTNLALDAAEATSWRDRPRWLQR